jgi:hypothetical protein
MKKRNKMKILTALTISTLVISSCTKIMYIPNAQNVPSLKSKNDIDLNIGIRNFQAAYAVTDHIGISANALVGGSEWTVGTMGNETEYDISRFNIEGAAGYYTNFAGNGIFQVFGGGGIGKYDYDYYDLLNGVAGPLNEYTANSIKLYLQPAIGMSSDYFDMFFSTRLVGLNFTGETTNIPETELVEEDLSDLLDPFYTFLEPCVTFRFGYKWVKFHFQTMYSVIITEQALNYMPFNVNIGLNINISPGLFQ